MKTIVIFAAGKGTRMQGITDLIPKPLINICGKPLLQYALEFTLSHKFDRVIINTHHLSDQIDEFVDNFKNTHKPFPQIILEHEPILLETGGTIKKLAKLYDLGNKIFTLNSDVIIRSDENLFTRMDNIWKANKMDILMLLQDTKFAHGYTGSGDFNLRSDGSINRHAHPPYPYMFAGMHILNPEIIAQNIDDIFSLKEYYPQIGKFSEVYNIRAIPMNGNWYHATKPDDIIEIEATLK